VIHGTADETVPFAHGRALGQAASAAHRTGAMFTIQGAGHSPDGADVSAILRAVAAKTQANGGPVKAQLPQTVQLTPF
jgi:dipeptidyl aminopeptidase/acylaminoacyl peptidase